MSKVSSDVVVSIPFVRVSPDQNPNSRIRGQADPSESYFRAMTVTFASLRRWNPNLDLELVSNVPPPDAFQIHFSTLGVRSRIVPFNHEPPVGFTERFMGSLYLLDALTSASAEKTVFLDPDVLCIRSLSRLLSETDGRVGVLRMDFPENEDINGLTRLEAGRIHTVLGKSTISPVHYGGEIYVVPRPALHDLVDECEIAWAFTLDRHTQGLSKFLTEEHILSFALRYVPVQELAGYVERIWTTHRHRRVDGNESSLTLWHLPAEKDRGFQRIFDACTDPDSWFWNSDQDAFIQRAGREMGLHHRGPMRLALDGAGTVYSKLTSKFSKLRAKS